MSRLPAFIIQGFNIDSLTVGETEEHLVSRMTIAVSGDDAILERGSAVLRV